MYWTEEITLMQDKPEKKQGVLVHSYTLCVRSTESASL